MIFVGRLHKIYGQAIQANLEHIKAKVYNSGYMLLMFKNQMLHVYTVRGYYNV